MAEPEQSTKVGIYGPAPETGREVKKVVRLLSNMDSYIVGINLN